MINFRENHRILIKWRPLRSWAINFPLERQLPHTVLFKSVKNQSKTFSPHRDPFAYSKTDFSNNDEIMTILANFNHTEIILEVKKMTSSLNTSLPTLSTQDLLGRSLKDDFKPELHLHFQVTLKNTKTAYFAVFHTKSPWKQNPFYSKQILTECFKESETGQHKSDQIPWPNPIDYRNR